MVLRFLVLELACRTLGTRLQSTCMRIVLARGARQLNALERIKARRGQIDARDLPFRVLELALGAFTAGRGVGAVLIVPGPTRFLHPTLAKVANAALF